MRYWLPVSLVLFALTLAACRHGDAARVTPPAPAPCYGAFVKRLLAVQAERARVAYPARAFELERLSDLLRRLEAVAFLVEDSPSLNGVLCPVVERFGEVPPAAVAEKWGRCGSYRQDHHQAPWEFSIGRALSQGDVAEARRWLRYTLQPSPQHPSRTPPCDCATRFLAQSLDATLEALSRPDLGADARRALLAFAIAQDALHDEAVSLDKLVEEVQAQGLLIVCADLPAWRGEALVPARGGRTQDP
jgi:hypothetical protein